MIKAFIVDDEKHCIATLAHLLSACDDLLIAGTAHDGKTAIAAINAAEPDLLFLDIQMPGLTGFQLLGALSPFPVEVVFTTAYTTYTVEALRLHAFDYLLKPINAEEIDRVLANFRYRAVTESRMHAIGQTPRTHVGGKIAIPTQKGLIFLAPADIIYLEASNCYTLIAMQNGDKHLVTKTLASFEQALKIDPAFFRVHKTFLINLQFIDRFNRSDGGEIIMTDGSRIAISRHKKREFLALFPRLP